MDVCVIGGGHIGTTLACYVKHETGAAVRLMTRRPERFAKVLTCNDWEGNTSFQVQLDAVSDDPAIAAAPADIIFIALPHFAIEQTFAQIAPHVKQGACICVLPGGGGCEFIFERYFGDRAFLAGFQRVPFTAKLQEYGHEANLKSWKPFSVVGTLQESRLKQACTLIQECGLKTREAANYLAVALTPTNPVLHTSRTYEIFGAHEAGYEFPERLKFYVGWTDAASRTLFAVDSELHSLLDAIPELDLTAIRPLGEHYEAPTVEDMTAKINSIATFQSVYAPMVESPNTPGTYVADLTSRMFTEDFPWGLAVIRGYCEIYGIDAPKMDEVLGWYAGYRGFEYYVDGQFAGKDLANTGIPQRFGISTREDILNLYAR